MVAERAASRKGHMGTKYLDAIAELGEDGRHETTGMDTAADGEESAKDPIEPPEDLAAQLSQHISPARCQERGKGFGT